MNRFGNVFKPLMWSMALLLAGWVRVLVGIFTLAACSTVQAQWDGPLVLPEPTQQIAPAEEQAVKETTAHAINTGCQFTAVAVLAYLGSPWVIVPAIYALGTLAAGPNKEGGEHDWVAAMFSCVGAAGRSII